MNSDDFNSLVEQIYDCAIAPSGWSDTLSTIRDEIDSAYAAITIAEFTPDSPTPRYGAYHSPWDEHWITELQQAFPLIPRLDRMRAAPLDAPVTQLGLLPEAEYRASEFYKRWAAPQDLFDTMNTVVVRRDRTMAWLVTPSRADRALYGPEEVRFAARVSPHLRRALLIGGMLELAQERARLSASLLDQFDVAVYLVGENGQLSQTNAAGEALLSRGDVLAASGGMLRAVSALHRGAFAEAVARACTGSDSDIGLWGNGMPLSADAGLPYVAYVLPMGRSELRNAMGSGHAAVFVSLEGARPPSAELLSALSGLSNAEAAVAVAIAAGKGPQQIAAEQGLSVHTVRKHLAHAFDKTGRHSQAALASYVNGLGLPMRRSKGLDDAG